MAITTTVEKNKGENKASWCNGSTYEKHVYDSIQDITSIKTPYLNENNKKKWASYANSYKDIKSTWLSPNGSTNVEIEQFCKTGWQDGSDKALKLIDTISLPIVESVKRKRVRSDRGDELDIHQVYRGELNKAWKRTKRLSKKAPKRFTLVARIGANCNTDSDELFWRGVSTLALATVLTKAGHSVEIIGYIQNNGCYGNKANSSRLDIVTVKNFQNPLDVDALANVLCLSGFFRHFMFRAWLTSERTVVGSYGQAKYEKLDFRSGNTKATQIDIQSHKLRNKETVERFIKDTIQSI